MSTTKVKKIGVLTSGGDAPGMNAAIRAVVRKAVNEGLEVVGIKSGYWGLIHDEMVEMNAEKVSNITPVSGTILYTERCLEFKTEDGMQKAIETCKKHNIDAIVAIGGDGTFRGATELANRGILTIGIPATIDNDITSTDYTIGCDTAMNTTLDMIDCLRDTCESHARVNVVEVMGRRCGDIAILSAIASGSTAAVVTEVPFSEDEIIERIRNARAQGQRGMSVVVSEGVFAEDGTPYGEHLAKAIQEKTGVETKFARFAHIIRGGKPSLRDRLYPARMAVVAVDLLLEGKSNMVITVQGEKIVPMDINFALTADRMYKKKLREGELERYTPEEIKEMEAICQRRLDNVRSFEDILVSTGIH